jgi:hypothetical protein
MPENDQDLGDEILGRMSRSQMFFLLKFELETWHASGILLATRQTRDTVLTQGL